MKTTKHFALLLLCALLYVAATFAQSNPNTVSQDITIIIQQEQVRFTSQKAVQMMQLQIFSQSGEKVYDSGPTTVPDINWPLQNSNGEALKSGLYAYTLSIQESSAAEARVRRGHFIVDRAKDRDDKTDKLWVTSQKESGIGTELTVARNEDSTVAGTSVTSDRTSTTERDSTAREVTDRGETPSTTKTSKATTEATSGTAGQIAKFTSGADLGNSVMTELNGNIGIGINSPKHRLSIAGTPSWTSNGWGGAMELTNGSAIGWQANAAGQRFGMGHTNAGFYIFRTASDPGTRNSQANYDLFINDAGNVGIGTITPRADFKLNVVGGNQQNGIGGYSTTNAGIYGESAQFNGVRGVAHNVAHGAVVGVHANGGLGVLGQSNGIGVYGKSLAAGAGVFGESAQYEGVRGLAHNVNHGGVVGIHDGGGFGVYGTSAGTGVQGDSTSVNGAGGYFRNTAGGAALVAEGLARVNVLEITGGADFAENFDVNAAETTGEVITTKVEAGMVVSIDPARHGQLRLSTQAYDRRVAGIISGAGGVNPGMRMGQAGTLAAGKHPVALSGRVYCWVDASQSAVKAGDLLTTSTTPGYAMKATNRTKAQGAILGKAMTGLKAGKGLVLVLVTLQ